MVSTLTIRPFNIGVIHDRTKTSLKCPEINFLKSKKLSSQTLGLSDLPDRRFETLEIQVENDQNEKMIRYFLSLFFSNIQVSSFMFF